MPDIKKVIDGLEHCSKGPIGCQTNCPYQRDFGCRAQLTEDSLAMLKEYEDQIERLEYDLAVTKNNLNYYVNGND